jgi:hypothetical protein
MKNPFKPGAHFYNGKRNSRAKRLASKITKGTKPIPNELWEQLENSDAQHRTDQTSRL